MNAMQLAQKSAAADFSTLGDFVRRTSTPPPPVPTCIVIENQRGAKIFSGTEEYSGFWILTY